MMFLRVIKHLLPNAKAWRITAEKNLRNFFEGLAPIGDGVKAFYDRVWLEIFPQTTESLDAWDEQFGLRETNITEQERRDRLAATWKAVGGQDPRYIQDTLRANGFDVYVHEWWVPGTEPAPGDKQCVTPRSPLTVLRREFTGADLKVDCGEPLAQCGESFAEAGNGANPLGYPLVNKVFQSQPDLVTLCGEAEAACGEAEAACGNYFKFREVLRDYIVPADPTKWPYFLYIGGENFGTIAQVDPKRRDEFEALCLKICPTQQWLGVLVEYN